MDLVLGIPLLLFFVLAPIAAWVGFFIARRAARKSDTATKELHQALTVIGAIRSDLEELREGLQEKTKALATAQDRNASSWEGKAMYRGQGNYRDRVSWDRDARPTELWTFSQSSLYYLVVRSMLAHVLDRDVETRQFVTRAMTLYPDAKEIEQLKPLIVPR